MTSFLKRIRGLLLHSLRPLSLAIFGLLLVGGLVFFRLHTLLPQLSGTEVSTRTAASNLRHIVNNPINAPYTLLVYLSLRFRQLGPFAPRAIGALYGIVILGLFFYILRRWQSVRIAILGTILFGTSSWFLHITRGGTPEVLQFGLLALVAAGLWLRDGRQRRLALFISVVVFAGALYIPGLVWFALLGILWRRQTVLTELRHIKWWMVAIGVLLCGGLVTPLGLAIAHHHQLALSVLGLPSRLPSLATIGHNLLNIPRFLFIHGPTLPAEWLGRTAILNIFETVMFALGVYAEIRFVQLDRARLLLGILLVSTVLLALGGPVTISLLMPFIYLIIAAGVTYLLYEWFRVFPFNPVARSLGLGILVVAIVASAGYQLDRYFIAWAHSPATHAAYNQRP